ncbi:MAG TPA: MBL fold metallo-hydrolase [Ktedonobacterales bacterium]|jgi:glyoxylase-like metal-dependent hydrolase (beta-lactamase superfamily II)
MTSAGDARRLDDHLWVIDTGHQGQPGVVASYLLDGPHGLGLVDVGSGATVENLLAGVRTAGFDPVQIERILLTHIHLDHAGATGALIAQLPRAQAYVHRLGKPHLIDPSRLVRSATRIYGERMSALWGEIVPVPQERLRVVDDGDEITVGPGELRVLYTPGHAIHHVAFFDEWRAFLFPGDVAGVRLEEPPLVRPPTPPPDLGLEDWYASLDRILALRPKRTFLPHFGPVDEVEEHIAELRERLRSWGDLALAGMRAGRDAEGIARTFAESDLARLAGLCDPAVARRYEVAANYLMSAQGYVRYFQTQHPELLL